MKFTICVRNGRARCAVVDGDVVIDLNGSEPEVSADLRTALRAGSNLHAAGAAAICRDAVRRPRSPMRSADA